MYARQFIVLWASQMHVIIIMLNKLLDAQLHPIRLMIQEINMLALILGDHLSCLSKFCSVFSFLMALSNSLPLQFV